MVGIKPGFAGLPPVQPSSMPTISAPAAPASSGISTGGAALNVAMIIGQEIFAGIQRKKAAKRQMKASLFTGD